MLKDKVKVVQSVLVENSYNGPHGNRKLTKNAYAEFASVADTKKALEALKDFKWEVGSLPITIKQSRTQQQSQRNWALTEADRLIKAHASSNGAEITLEWKDRAVKVNGQIAFQQNKIDVGGTFNAPFGSIELP